MAKVEDGRMAKIIEAITKPFTYRAEQTRQQEALARKQEQASTELKSAHTRLVCAQRNLLNELFQLREEEGGSGN